MRVLACPLASYGYVYPMIGIGERLKADGHELAFATSREFAGDIAAAGFDRIPAGADDVSSFEVHSWWKPYAAVVQELHVEWAIRTYRPDLLLSSQLALGPIVAGERHGLPIALLGFGAYLYPRVGCEQPGSSRLERLAWWRFESMQEIFDRVRGKFGLPADNRSPGKSRLLGDQLLLQTSPELEGSADSLPDRVRPVGYCGWEPAMARHEDLVRWLDADDPRPILYVQHGRVFDMPRFIEMLLDSAAALPVRVVASVGKLGPEAPPPTTSPNLFLRPHVPQGVVLERATGVVANGNTTVVLGSLEKGLPLVLVPTGNEHHEVADRCCRSGAAIVVRSDELSPGRVCESIHRLITDDALRASAAMVAVSLSRMGRFAAVREALEDLLEGRAG